MKEEGGGQKNETGQKRIAMQLLAHQDCPLGNLGALDYPGHTETPHSAVPKTYITLQCTFKSSLASSGKVVAAATALLHFPSRKPGTLC